MKRIILIASLFVISNAANCQRNTMINTKDLSPFSVGVMPVIFVSSEDGPGLGLELNGRYGLTKDFGVGIFGRMKSIMKDNSSYSDEYGSPINSIESTNVFAVGAAIDYHLFKAVALQLRGGYEAEADAQKEEMIPRFIYGGGVLIKFGNSLTHKIAHSLRFGIDFESNKTMTATIPTADFSDFPYSQQVSESDVTINAFSFQVGWNFQFNFIKRR